MVVRKLVAQSYLTLCNPMDYSLLGSPVVGIFQARILEWVAISFSRDLPNPGIEHRSPALQTDSLPFEPQGNPRWMWEPYHKEEGGPRNWCFWTVVLDKTLQSSLDCKEIQPVHPKGDQSWIFTGRTDAEAEAPILWPELTHQKRHWC